MHKVMKNLIFLTMARMTDIECRGIYSDLLRKFREEGWEVYIVTPRERSLGMPTELNEQSGVHILGVKTLNLQKTSIIEKGLGQVLVEGSIPGKVINTVGAGDSMVAGFITGYIHKHDYGYALKLGAAAGSATACSPGLGTKEEVERRMSL